jgi:dTDP-4-amino-4,6-dideoxy-D-glucose transaminase
MIDGPIYVTRPYLPPLGEFLSFLERIWESRILSNHGPFHQQFEQSLAQFLGVEYVSLTTNGMLALETALAVADLQGEIITTPYSFVATTHAVRRSGLQPVFVDIRAEDLNINVERVEERITGRTTAIVAVHCYGNPCDTDRLQAIADRYGLKIIYDAAHAFGVRRHGRSILANGAFSILSFHATKAFNTFEGGAVVASDRSGKSAVDSFRNFGIADEVTITSVGGNAKMSEFNAALGLLQLGHFHEVVEARRRVDQRYRDAFVDSPGIEPINVPTGVEPNFSYFPVLVTEAYQMSRDALYERLKARNIFSRRYFYPLLSGLPAYRDEPSADPRNLPVATRTANQILCLPIFHDLSIDDQDRIIAIISD